METGAPGRALNNRSSLGRSSTWSSPAKPHRRRSHSVDHVTPRDKDRPRRSLSPRERRLRNHRKESRYFSDEAESDSEYEEKRRTRSPPSRRSRSTSVSYGPGQERGRGRRRESEREFTGSFRPTRSNTTPAGMEHLLRHHHYQPQSGGVVDVGARPDQFVPFPAPARPKRASTVTGYAIASGNGGGIPVPILLPAPVTRRNSSPSTAAAGNSRSSSTTAASRSNKRREEIESGRDTSHDTENTDIETDPEEHNNNKRWAKYRKPQQQLPSSATRES